MKVLKTPISAIIALALLTLVGCAAPDEKIASDQQISISDNLTVDEQQQVILAIDAWNLATNGRIALRPSIGGQGLPISNGYAVGNLGEWDYNDGNPYIVVDTEVLAKCHGNYSENFRTTVMHELGHAFGLEHVATGLMMASGPGKPIIDDDARDRVCANYGGCDLPKN